MKVIYFKTEPAGEIGFGKLNKSDIKIIKSLIKLREMKGSDYVEDPHNFCQDNAYGVFINDQDTIDGELPQYEQIETISFLKDRQYEDGWYIVHTALSKGSIQFEFEPDGGSFDISELVIQLQRVDLRQLSDDLYGELNFTVLSDVQYQGEPIHEFYDAELIDRGLDREVHIVEIKHGKFNLVYKNRNTVDESYYEEGILVAQEDNSLDRDQAIDAVSIDDFTSEEHDESLIEDREALLSKIAENVFAMQDAKDSLKKDKKFIMQAVRINGSVIEFIDDYLKKDREIVIQAIMQDGGAFEFADESLKNDKEFVMEAASIDGNAVLFYASESLQDDKEVVLAAIKQNPDAIDNASDNLQNDPFIIKASSKQE